MLEDVQGLPVTTDSPAAIAALNHFIDQSLSYGRDAENVVLTGLTADPDCAMLHAYAAAYYLSQENAEARRFALAHVEKMQQPLKCLTLRETLYIRAIAAWAAHSIDQAIHLHEAIAQQFPQDLISVQQGQYHYFYRGDAVRLLQIAERVLPAHPDNHYLYGMIAFGLEQAGNLPAAEQFGRRALAINRCDPWAQHAIAHVLETQERTQEGIAWMEQYTDTWECCNSMLYTHNWWHLALFHLKQGNFERVLNLYDRHIWGRARKESPKDQVGAIATLLRLELKGVDVGARWQALSPYLPLRLHEHALPFQDLHFIYALARSGQSNWTTEMLTSMQDHANHLPLPARQTWTGLVLPAAEGMIAHAKGDWSKVVTRLQSVLPHLSRIGGSHTQRQLFQQVYQHAFQHQISKKTLHYQAIGHRSETTPRQPSYDRPLRVKAS